jgi:hypothetical protein
VPIAVGGVPVLPLLGIAASLGLLVQLEPAVLVAGTVVALASGAVALVVARRSGPTEETRRG